MTEKDLDIAIEKCERIMEFDTRTMRNPVSENGWIFEKVYELLQYLRQFQFATDTNVGGNLIDRQAAIAVADSADYLGLAIEDVKKVTDEVVKGLKQLPSAQPREDIRATCGECDAWNRYKNYPQPGWIPCSDALPSEYDKYLITTEDGMVVFGVYDPKEEQWSRYDSIKSWWLYGIKVLAWQPLPKPWEGENNG